MAISLSPNKKNSTNKITLSETQLGFRGKTSKIITREQQQTKKVVRLGCFFKTSRFFGVLKNIYIVDTTYLWGY
jgi:hypothetical protein